MKILNIDGRILGYRVIEAESWGNRTEFYEGHEVYQERKYYLFGPKVTRRKPKYVFTIYWNIEYPGYSKKDVYEAVQRKLKFLNREDEIKKGEVV